MAPSSVYEICLKHKPQGEENPKLQGEEHPKLQGEERPDDDDDTVYVVKNDGAELIIFKVVTHIQVEFSLNTCVLCQ